MKEVLSRALALAEAGEAYVVVTFLSGRGHLPQEPGAKALVSSRGLEAGTIGGGKVEARAIREALAMLVSPPAAPVLVEWNLQRDIGMSCGGEGKYLFEHFHSAGWRVALFGAGHIAQATARLLLTLDCRVTVVDSRDEWLAKLPESPALRRIHTAEPAREVAALAGSFLAVMTQGHATDFPVLREIFSLPEPMPYVGVIGSTTKAVKIKSELRALGLDEEKLNRLRCPMGLDIGTNQPAEIAVSIVAELLQARDRHHRKHGAAAASASGTSPGAAHKA